VTSDFILQLSQDARSNKHQNHYVFKVFDIECELLI